MSNLNVSKSKGSVKLKNNNQILINEGDYYLFGEKERINLDIKKIEVSVPKCKIMETFEKYFPNKTIKPLQYNIVKSIQNNLDIIGILPTGYGKSACYQIPFLMNMNKLVLIVSPLISLMEDQKDKLDKLGIPCACFHSNVGKKKKAEIKVDIFENLLSDKNGMIIFLTPEYLINCETWIKQLVSQNKLSLVAFDEAHCISTWGHDFRPDYQGLFRVKDWIKEVNGQVPLLALTATATKQVEEDIKMILGLENPQIFKTSFDRPNLIINVYPKPKDVSKIFPILNEYIDDFTIIYCKTRDKAEEVCSFLKENEYNADVYHAGLAAASRLDIQTKFAEKELNIIVATIAFGMGIDQNIHLVIHWGCPSDMESYYQEIGRAGRDGIESKCYLYYDKDDFRVSRYFLRSLTDNGYKRFKDEQISKMERYCLLPDCRRKMVLTHFGEILSFNYACNKCDNCTKQDTINKAALNNLQYPIFIIIKTVFLVKCKFGIGKLYLILKGSKSKTISEFFRIATYGLLKDLSEEQIKCIINILTVNGLLKDKTITGGFGSVLETTAKSVQYYTKLNREIGKLELTYNALHNILNSQYNRLELKIPLEYNDLIKIKYKTIAEDLITEFDLDN